MTTNKSQQDSGRQNAQAMPDTRQTFDPMTLETIELAAYVLGLLRKGVTTRELAYHLDENYSLVGAYLRLFVEWMWIEQRQKDGKWILTKIGLENQAKFQKP